MKYAMSILAALAVLLTTPVVAEAHGHHRHHHKTHFARGHHARQAGVPCRWSAYFEECLTLTQEQEIEASVSEAFAEMEAEGWREPTD